MTNQCAKFEDCSSILLGKMLFVLKVTVTLDFGQLSLKMN